MVRAVFILLLLPDLVVLGQIPDIREHEAKTRSAGASFAAGQQAAQQALLANLARRNAANRAKVLAQYAQEPPLKEYSRKDQLFFKEQIEPEIARRNAEVEAEFEAKMRIYHDAMREWSIRKLEIDKAYAEAVAAAASSGTRVEKEQYPDQPIAPQKDDPPLDAREFQINDEKVVCSYIARLRVPNRKYDVFFAVKEGLRYQLAWISFRSLSGDDQRWIGAEDARRRSEKAVENEADSAPATAE